MAISTRGQQFQQLAGAVPVTNQAIASGMQQARETQLQQQIGAMPAQAASPKAAQQIGAQQAGAAANIALQQKEQADKQIQQVANTAINQQRLDSQKQAADQRFGIVQRQRQLTNKLSNLNADLKNKLFDQQMAFQKDELGRTVFNERQLMDFKLRNAQDDEELRDYEQNVRQLSDRKMKMLEMSYKKITQELDRKATNREQELSQAQKLRLAQAKRALEEKMAREKAEAANRAAMFSTVGMIAGAVIGGIAGGPVGAGAGASGGAAAGNMAAARTA